MNTNPLNHISEIDKIGAVEWCDECDHHVPDDEIAWCFLCEAPIHLECGKNYKCACDGSYSCGTGCSD